MSCTAMLIGSWLHVKLAMSSISHLARHTTRLRSARMTLCASTWCLGRHQPRHQPSNKDNNGANAHNTHCGLDQQAFSFHLYGLVVTPSPMDYLVFDGLADSGQARAMRHTGT